MATTSLVYPRIWKCRPIGKTRDTVQLDGEPWQVLNAAKGKRLAVSLNDPDAAAALLVRLSATVGVVSFRKGFQL
jgi:hypothetical protein